MLFASLGQTQPIVRLDSYALMSIIQFWSIIVVTISSLQLSAQNMTKQNLPICDPETGLCTLAPIEGTPVVSKTAFRTDISIIYVGDPMCSWCWGISPSLQQLSYRAAQEGIPFRLVMGGLRPGGGDEWNEKFKDFLRHHWAEVNKRSGQPFGNELFDRAEFNYDTEPSCRAVVAARQMDPELEHRFFELVQHHFYVQNEDPTQVAFYQPICKTLDLDFTTFSALFESEKVKAATQTEFALNRQWGVRGFPSVLLQKGDKLYLLANGFATFEQLWAGVEAQN